MKNYLIILFVFFATTSLFGQLETELYQTTVDYPDTVVYNEQSSLYLKKYVNRIDSLGFNDLLRLEIEKDSRCIFYKNDYYSISDFLVFMMALNSFTSNRVEFVQSMLEKGKIKNENVLSIKCFIDDDFSCILNQTQNNSLERNSLLESIKLSLFIRQKKLNTINYNEFKKIADSVYCEFQKIPLTKADIRLLLPIFEILNIWYDKYPKKAEREALKFINKKQWSVLEPTLLFDYIKILKTNRSIENRKYKALALSYPTIDVNLGLWRSKRESD